MDIKIYQLKDMEFATKLIEIYTNSNVTILRDNYKLMYEYEDKSLLGNSDMGILNHIWNKFNDENRPNGDKMRSLSISDIVGINDNYYFCNLLGWKKVKFNGEEALQIR
ncbi:YodL domain-containing protein [Bacillus cereus]|uniref:YodL domain-containing protein n=1 Tax=Bacillus cereus TaxID=1396 RepID=UPI0030791BDC